MANNYHLHDPRRDEIDKTTTNLLNTALTEAGWEPPLYIVLYNQIRYYELYGKLRLGFSVASKDQLAEQFGVTVNQINKAYDNLTNKYKLGTWLESDKPVYKSIKRVWVSNEQLKNLTKQVQEYTENGVKTDDLNYYSGGAQLLQRRSSTITAEELPTDKRPLLESKEKINRKIIEQSDRSASKLATRSSAQNIRNNPTEPADAEPVELFLGDRTEPAAAEPVQSLRGVQRKPRPRQTVEQALQPVEQTLPSDQTKPVEQALQEKEKNSAQKEKEKNSAQKEKEVDQDSNDLLIVSVWQYTGKGNGRTVRRFMHPDEYDRIMDLDYDEYTNIETITQTRRTRKMRAKPKHITILYEGDDDVDDVEQAVDLTAYATIKYHTNDEETSVVNVNEEQYRTIRDSVNSGASRIQFISLPIKSKTGVVQAERSISFWASNIKNITVLKG